MDTDRHRIAAAVAADGVLAHEADVGCVVQAARRSGASRLLSAIALDPTEPEIVRARAFGRLGIAPTE